jgi:arylformamidase
MTDPSAPWQALADEECEARYNPQRAVPNFSDYGARRRPANEAALASPGRRADVRHGDHPLRRLDIYPAASPHRRPTP